MAEAGQINYIAWWGAILSTLLALIKLFEMWRDRFRIETGFTFNSDPEIGNEIIVRNLSGKPIILIHWELLYGTGKWPFMKLEEFNSTEPYENDVRIDGHSSHAFTFSENNYFGWSKDSLKNRKIYMYLYIAGKRPLLRKIYG